MAAPSRRLRGAAMTSGTTLTGLLTIGNKSTTDVNKNNGGSALMKPILENILDREKQNQEDVRRLKQILNTLTKRNIRLQIAVKTKEETTKNASSDVNDLKNALKDFRQSLSRTSSDLDPTSIDALLKTLNDLLAQEKDCVERLEKEKDDLEKRPKISPAESPVDEEKAAALKDAAKKYRDIVDDLKKLLRNCTKSINNAIGPDGKKEASNIEEALQKICDLADVLKEKRQEYDRSKSKLAKSEKEKLRLHQMLKNRLESRRPLEDSPNRLALEMEQLARKRSSWPPDCGQPAPVPERGDDLVSSLTNLYRWAEKELERGERARKSKSAESPAPVDADDGKKKLTDKDDELNSLLADIVKQEAEVKDSQGKLEESKLKAFDRKKMFKDELKSLIVLQSSSEKPAQKTNDVLTEYLQNEIVKEEKQLKDNLLALEKLKPTRQRQENELRDLNEVLRKRKLQSEAEKRDAQQSLARMQQRLQQFLQRRDALLRELRDAKSRPGCGAQGRDAAEKTSRNIERLREKIRKLNDAWKPLKREMGELGRRLADVQNQGRRLADEYPRKVSFNDDLEDELLKKENELEGKRANLRREQSRCQNLTDRAQFTFFNYQSATYLRSSAAAPAADPYDDDGYYRKYSPVAAALPLSSYRRRSSGGRSSSLDRSAAAESSRTPQAAAFGDDFLIDVEINPDITVNIENYDDDTAAAGKT